MNDVQRLLLHLQQHMPYLAVSIDEPQDPAGTWFIDLNVGGTAMPFQWREDQGFGFYDGIGEGYNQRPNKIVRNFSEAVEQVHRLVILLVWAAANQDSSKVGSSPSTTTSLSSQQRPDIGNATVREVESVLSKINASVWVHFEDGTAIPVDVMQEQR